jgi:hypothetical protein
MIVSTVLHGCEAVGRPIGVGVVGAGAKDRVVIQENPASQLPLGEKA